MANKIIMKKSSVAAKIPLSTDLEVGEIAGNLEDQKLYSKKPDGTVVLMGSGLGGSGDVEGPSSATDGAVALYDGTTGKLIKNGQVPGSIYTQDANNVNITGGSVSGITDLSIADGGTGASTAAAALSNLGGFPASAIPSGTKMLFIQTTAPAGWTKDTTHNNKSLRVVSGTAASGGSVAFTTAFASQTVSGTVANAVATGTVGSTVLTEAQLPSHTHSFSGNTGNQSANHDHGFSVSGNTNLVTTFPGGVTAANGASTGVNTNGTQITFSGSGTTQENSNSHHHSFSGTTNSTGSGTGHTHSFTGTAHNHTFTGTAINLAVQYVDTIIATKD